MNNKQTGRKEGTHTPGPWRYECTNAGVRVEATDGHIAIACRIMQNNWRNTFGKELNVHRNLQEVKANARLIAAAPELLEAARAAAGHVCTAFECGEDRHACPPQAFLRAAIAKATQEPK